MEVAFFDLDKTFLTRSSSEFLVDRLAPGLENQFKSHFLHLKYLLGRIDIVQAVEEWFDMIGSRSSDELEQIGQTLLWDKLIHLVNPKTLEIFRMHKKRGDRVVMITASLRFVAEPVSNHFAFDELICTEMQRDQGAWKLKLPVCFGNGKVELANQYIRKNNLENKSRYFYSDSINDLPLLNEVEKPFVIGPDVFLKKVAKEKRWPIITN